MDRSKKIIRTSVIGIGVNLILAAFKAAVGLVSGSIAIVMDAVNNLSDALSSVITIIGTAISGRAPDKEHPFGHGRVEYITSAIIGVIVLFAGISSLTESVKSIVSPQRAEYKLYGVIIIFAAVAAKLFVCFYFKKTGKALNSGALTASGTDAFFDAVLSAGTLVAAALSVFLSWDLEGVFGAIISLFIIRSGIGILSETASSIIGTRADKELTDRIKERIASFPQVLGVYDLTLHNYGPTNTVGTVHVELPADMTAREIHPVTRAISMDVFKTFGIIMTVGIYSSCAADPVSDGIRKALEEEVGKRKEVLELHAFNTDVEKKSVNFDLVMDFNADQKKVRDEIIAAMKERYPDFEFFAILDSDYSN
ncbi:MAG: cation transporter [Clostridia bacterium]|nr:cation transporter [Clostridia bacterium]